MHQVKRVLLIYPFTVIDSYNWYDIEHKAIALQPPLGLAYIMSHIKKALPHIEIDIFDAHAMAIKTSLKDKHVDMEKLWSLIKEKVKTFKPDLVGISCLFHATAVAAHKTANIVKNINPDIYVIVGGNYAHTSYDILLKECSTIDFVGFYEGEHVIENLINGLNQECALSSIRGIAYRDTEENIVKNEREMDIKDLDIIPNVDYSNFDLDFYSKHGHIVTHRFLEWDKSCIAALIASRGCPNRCTFCSARLFYTGKVRYRNPRRVVEEMKCLHETQGVNAFYFVDDNLFSIRKDFLALAREIRKNLPDIKWLSPSGMQISTLKDDVIDAIYESGCNFFLLPFESGCPETLRKIKKPHTLEMVSDALSRIRRYDDAYVCGNCITGFPFETKNDIQRSLAYAKKLDLDWLYIMPYSPLRGSPLYDECIRHGYLQEEPWSIRCTHDLLTLSTPHFDKDYVAGINYAVNAEVNFFRNRNIERRPQQAISDFIYVLRASRDNAMAMFGLGRAHQQLKDHEQSRKWFLRARDILENETAGQEKNMEEAGNCTGGFFVIKEGLKYSQYFDEAGIDIMQYLP